MSILLALIVLLFPIGILLRKRAPNLCAICFATSGAWIIGFIYMLISGSTISDTNILSLGILMGGSVVGSMYYLSSKLSEENQLFKLPYLITLFALVYMVLTREFVGSMVVGVGGLWLLFFLLFSVRDSGRLKGSIAHIIKCCKNW